MLYTPFLLAFSVAVSGHGLITRVNGANGVVMPGLSVIDGTPRNCAGNLCGAQADTSIIRDFEIRAGGSPLGRTQGGGPVYASTNVGIFMNGLPSQRRSTKVPRQFGTFVGGLFGAPFGGKTSSSRVTDNAPESGVKDTAGKGAISGLPTSTDQGVVNFIFHQVNQEGAGPYTAEVDPTSGGTDPSAFVPASVTLNVPGVVLGLSLVTTTSFNCAIQISPDTVCNGTVAGVENVCVFRFRNGNLAGPFGGSGAFVLPPAAEKRAMAFRRTMAF